uniref:solute carrier family 22 member 4-like n=1 Tax=Styela clava TaxID=7725 RepID=UPI00193A823D|nr:solute carrier family 22 member 4-like [Styela clava]
MNIDEAFHQLGKWGRYQSVIFIIVFAASLPNAFTTMQFAINHFQPSHRCRLSDEIENILKNNSNSVENLLDYFIPMETNNYGKLSKSKCHMYHRNYSTALSLINLNESVDIIPCTNGYIFDMLPNHDTAVTEFEMICNNDWKSPLAITVFQSGMASGSIAGILADRYGRRPVYLFATLAQIISMAITAASWDFYSYLVAVYFGGMTGLINYVVAFVLVTEVISIKSRNFMAVGSMYSYSVGYATFDWILCAKLACLHMGIHGTQCLSISTGLLVFPESPRWLSTVGRTNAAIAGLNKMAKMNRKKVDFERLRKVRDRSRLLCNSVPLKKLQ